MILAISAVVLLSVTGRQSPEYSWAPFPPGRAVRTDSLGARNATINTGSAVYFGSRTTTETPFGTRTIENRWDSSAAFAVIDATPFSIDYGPTDKFYPTYAKVKSSGPGICVIQDMQRGLEVTVKTSLSDNTHFMRYVVTLKPTLRDLNISRVNLLAISTGNQGRAGVNVPSVVGKTPGSPVLAGNIFFGIEHPMASWAESGPWLTGSIKRILPLRKGTTATYSYVIGVAPPGQMRRAFLSYVERERAHAYRPFLHYNSWYDIGYFTPYNEKDCLDRITKFGEELTVKRGVKLDSFLFDDGWDNYESVWEFHSGFPKAFLPLRDAAKKYGAGPGVWLSPWGGYGDPRKRRLAYGKDHGMEVDSQGYALSGPNYYKRFHDVTLDFVTRQGINHFKLDGTGSPDKTTPGSRFDSDFDAAISLIGDLRKARPDLFINLTTGTWPSPFWLRYADSIWRGGSDHSFAGVGSNRQQWITYRDSDTYHGVVERGPLYPLNSLMLHGIIYAKNAHNLNSDPGNDFADEVRSYFGTGTQLQEMYVTPDLLTKQNWDDLAAAAKWSRSNADVLKDTHWVGGDPARLDVYGWASWSPRKGILVLRNPSDKQQAFSVDIGALLEVPPRFARAYIGRDPYQSGAESTRFPVGSSVVLDLKPLEVKVLDLEVAK